MRFALPFTKGWIKTHDTLSGTKFSYGNAICFNDSPADMYGKSLSIPDTLIETYCKLLLPAADFSTPTISIRNLLYSAFDCIVKAGPACA